MMKKQKTKTKYKRMASEKDPLENEQLSPVNEEKSDKDSLDSDEKQLVEMDILNEKINKEINKKNRELNNVERAKTQSELL